MDAKTRRIFQGKCDLPGAGGVIRSREARYSQVAVAIAAKAIAPSACEHRRAVEASVAQICFMPVAEFQLPRVLCSYHVDPRRLQWRRCSLLKLGSTI